MKWRKTGRGIKVRRKGQDFRTLLRPAPHNLAYFATTVSNVPLGLCLIHVT
jgi:hypothetical protein